MFFKIKILIAFINLRFNRWYYKTNLNKLRDKRWKNFSKKLSDSLFYKDLVATKSPLKDYPIINKTIFMDNFDSMNTCGIKKSHASDIALKAENSRDFSPMINSITVGLSSGTSGNRGIFLASEKERAIWVACVLDRVLGFSLKKRTVAFFLRANSNLYDSVSSKLIKFEFFDLLKPLENQLDRLNNLNPNILVAQPSLLLEIAKKVTSNDLVISPNKIISVAEVLYPEDKVFLEKTFKQTIHQVYQCTEGLLATSCKHGNLHFNEDFLIIEKKYIDSEKKRFHPIITDLMRISQPIVRYELNDIIHEMSNCLCGNKTTAIKQIEGRSDDLLIFKTNTGKEVKIFPDFFRRAIILSDESIMDYSVTQVNKNEINLFIDNCNKYDLVELSIQNLLKAHEVLNVKIKRLSKRNHILGNKLIRIKNDYRQKNKN